MDRLADAEPGVADRQVVPHRKAPHVEVRLRHVTATGCQNHPHFDLVVVFFDAGFRHYLGLRANDRFRHNQKTPGRQAFALIFEKMILGKFLAGNRLEGVDRMGGDIRAERDNTAAPVGQRRRQAHRCQRDNTLARTFGGVRRQFAERLARLAPIGDHLVPTATAVAGQQSSQRVGASRTNGCPRLGDIDDLIIDQEPGGSPVIANEFHLRLPFP